MQNTQQQLNFQSSQNPLWMIPQQNQQIPQQNQQIPQLNQLIQQLNQLIQQLNQLIQQQNQEKQQLNQQIQQLNQQLQQQVQMIQQLRSQNQLEIEQLREQQPNKGKNGTLSKLKKYFPNPTVGFLIAASNLIIKDTNIPKIQRDEKRNKNLVLAWYERHWEVIEPQLSSIAQIEVDEKYLNS